MGHDNTRARTRRRDELTPRQFEILSLLAAGNTTPEIARRLGVAEGTVKTHLTNLYRKIDADNRIQATLYYIEHHGPPARGGGAAPADDERP